MSSIAGTRSIRWDLLGALFISGWVTSLAGSAVANLATGGALGATPSTSLVAIFVGVVLQAVLLRYVIHALGAGRISLGNCLVVAAVGHLTKAVGMLLLRGQLGEAAAFGGMTTLLSLVGVFVQYQLLLLLVDENEPELDESQLVASALMETDELSYADVLRGVRETTSAVNFEIASSRTLADSVDDELLALTVHERRLRALGPPADQADYLHDTFVEAIGELRAQLLARQYERRPEPPAADKVLSLARELAAFAPQGD